MGNFVSKQAKLNAKFGIMFTDVSLFYHLDTTRKQLKMAYSLLLRAIIYESEFNYYLCSGIR